MNSITIKRKRQDKAGDKVILRSLLSVLANSYREFLSNNSNEPFYWYMKVVLIIPCVVMVPTIMLMAFATVNYVWFVGLSMTIFFSNICLHLAKLGSSIYIPFYHSSIFILIIIPIITYLLSL